MLRQSLVGATFNNVADRDQVSNAVRVNGQRFPEGELTMVPQDDRPDSADRPTEAFLEVREAESTADVHALTERLKRAILQANLLQMPDVTRLIEQAIDAAEHYSSMDATIAGEPVVVKSIGQHEPEAS